MDSKDELILEMAEDIKNYQLEIVSLRAYISKDFPGLKHHLYSDLTPSFIYNGAYRKLLKETGRDPFEDKYFIKELHGIERNGYSDKHPFSI